MRFKEENKKEEQKGEKKSGIKVSNVLPAGLAGVTSICNVEELAKTLNYQKNIPGVSLKSPKVKEEEQKELRGIQKQIN